MKNRSIDRPYFCHNLPFIRQNKANISPFVCHNEPFIFFIFKNNGFTLIELVVVIVIVGLLAALAIPNMSQFIESNKLTTQANDLLADISVARSEAIKQSKQTGICTLAAGSSPPACNTTTSWNTGWLVFVDEDNSGGWTSGDKIVRQREAAASNITVSPTEVTGTTPSAASAIVFKRTGEANLASGRTFVTTVCSTKLKKSRVLTILGTGRPAMSEGTC